MATYEEIRAANEAAKTTKVKGGADYIMVNARVDAFRRVYPTGTIFAEILNLSDEEVTMKATVYDGDRVLAVGHAHEMKASSAITRDSMLEVCETSCIGRALGFAGFGIDASIASKEEVEAAKKRAEASKRTTSAAAASTAKPVETAAETERFEPITKEQEREIHTLTDLKGYGHWLTALVDRDGEVSTWTKAKAEFTIAKLTERWEKERKAAVADPKSTKIYVLERYRKEGKTIGDIYEGPDGHKTLRAIMGKIAPDMPEHIAAKTLLEGLGA